MVHLFVSGGVSARESLAKGATVDSKQATFVVTALQELYGLEAQRVGVRGAPYVDKDGNEAREATTYFVATRDETGRPVVFATVDDLKNWIQQG